MREAVVALAAVAAAVAAAVTAVTMVAAAAAASVRRAALCGHVIRAAVSTCRGWACERACCEGMNAHLSDDPRVEKRL